MSGIAGACFVFSLVLSAACPGLAHQLDLNLKITLRVYNYAKASGVILEQAKREANRIFQVAGIETVWLDCLSHPTGEHPSTPCQKPVTAMDLVLRILAEHGSTRREFLDTHLGFALPSDKGGSYASIFYPDVENSAENEGVPQNQLLGHAIAHEIGHLLLNSSAHSPSGLMRGKWDSKDLRHATRGDLLFTADQAATMRVEVLRRIRRCERQDTNAEAGVQLCRELLENRK
jgi:hypothetical protein